MNQATKLCDISRSNKPNFINPKIHWFMDKFMDHYEFTEINANEIALRATHIILKESASHIIKAAIVEAILPEAIFATAEIQVDLFIAIKEFMQKINNNQLKLTVFKAVAQYNHDVIFKPIFTINNQPKQIS